MRLPDRRSFAAISSAFILTAALAPSALADDPASALRAAVQNTARAKTGRVAVTEHATFAGRTLDSTASGVLVGGDSDLVASGENGRTHRVSVGTEVRERAPDLAGTPWRASTRAAPSQSVPFAAATLKDGTSIGDPKLYRSVTDAGIDTLPHGPARKLVGDLDMGAVAQAMEFGASDQARMAQWKATLTLWVGSDGTVARNELSIVMPSATADPETLDLTIDLSDLGAPLQVTLP